MNQTQNQSNTNGTTLNELQFLQELQKAKEFSSSPQAQVLSEPNTPNIPKINNNQNNPNIQQLINEINNQSSLQNLYKNPNQTTIDKIKLVIKQKLNEYILFIIVYTLLAQSFFKDALCKYIPQIGQTNDKGDTTVLGVILHGFIVLVVFEITKFFLNN